MRMTRDFHLAERTLAVSARAHIMAVVNVTPDSFSDGGLFAAHDDAIAHAHILAREGADMIDVGGESTRPGAHEIDCAEEIRRVLPVVRTLAIELSVPLSIDTYKARTADAALEAGAEIVNDVWGFQRDPDMARVAANFHAGVILMHNRIKADAAINIIDDIRAFFARSIETALRAGVREERIVLDPGLGFGKTFEQNHTILSRLPELVALGFPVLVGASRKSFIGALTGRTTPSERLAGTLSAHVLAVARGASIVRVHDVAAHVDALAVAKAIMQDSAHER